MKGGFRILAVLPWLIAALAAPAAAALIGFGDRASWEAAASGGNLFLEDFESFNTDTSFSSTPVDVGGFAIGEIGGVASTSSVNLIDTTDMGFLFSGDNAIDGNAYAMLWSRTPASSPYVLGSSTYVEIVFAEPVFAFGADYNRTSSIGLIVFLLPVGGDPGTPGDWIPCNVCSVGFGESFVGFVGDGGELFTRMAFLPSSSDANSAGAGARVGMDNAAWATVPEPSASILFGLGLTGIAFVGRRRH